MIVDWFGSTINYPSMLLSSLGFKYFYNQDCIYNCKNHLLRAKDSFVFVFLKTGVYHILEQWEAKIIFIQILHLTIVVN